MTEPTASPAGKAPLSAMLHTLAGDECRDRIAVGDLLAAPLVFLDVQLAFGRSPWLPAVFARRTMTRSDFAAPVSRIGPRLARAARLLRPRRVWLAQPPMECLVGLVCLLLAVVLVLPIPLGNMLPALAISLLELGVLKRDGLWILAGLVAAVAAAVAVSGVALAMVKAGVYFLAEILR